MAEKKPSKKKVATKSKNSSTPKTDPKKGVSVQVSKFQLSRDSFKLSPKKMKVLAWVLLVVASFILIDLFVQYLNNGYSAAVVNGVRISRTDYVQRLEDQYGESVVRNMVNEELIMQEAEAQEVTVSDAEINEVVQQTVEELGGQEQYEAALEANDLTDEGYRRDLRLRLLAQKILVEDPTEDELREFFTQYKSVYFDEEDKFEDNVEEVEQIYYTQKFNEQSTQWLDQLREDSIVQDNVAEEPKYGLLQVTRNIIENLIEQVRN